MRRIYFRRHKKSQAAVEMGIFAAFIFVVLGVLFNYIEILNYDQMATMESFRRGLNFAGNNNSVVSYNLMRHRKSVNVQGDLGQGSRAQSQGAAQVYWAVPFVGESPKSDLVYKINDESNPFQDMLQVNFGQIFSSLYQDASAQTGGKETYLGQGKTLQASVGMKSDKTATMQDKVDVTFEGSWGFTRPTGKQFYLEVTPEGFYKYVSAAGDKPIVERVRDWNPNGLPK